MIAALHLITFANYPKFSTR